MNLTEIKNRIAAGDPITPEEFVCLKYPPPEPEDDAFFEAWGYDQWLIKKHGKDIKQLAISERTAYNAFRIAQEYLKPGEDVSAMEERIIKRRRPVVVANRYLDGFFVTPAAKGCAGVSLWQNEDGSHFCLFVKNGSSPIPPLSGNFTPGEDITVTDTLYTGEDQVIEMTLDHAGFTHPKHTEGRFIVRPNGEVWYAWAVDYRRSFGGIAGTAVTLTWAKAPTKKSDGYKRPLKRNCSEERLSWGEFENLKPYSE